MNSESISKGSGGNIYKFRITHPDVYPEGSLGHSDISARQGEYIDIAANSFAAACCKLGEALAPEVITRNAVIIPARDVELFGAVGDSIGRQYVCQLPCRIMDPEVKG